MGCGTPDRLPPRCFWWPRAGQRGATRPSSLLGSLGGRAPGLAAETSGRSTAMRPRACPKRRIACALPAGRSGCRGQPTRRRVGRTPGVGRPASRGATAAHAPSRAPRARKLASWLAEAGSSRTQHFLSRAPPLQLVAEFPGFAALPGRCACWRMGARHPVRQGTQLLPLDMQLALRRRLRLPLPRLQSCGRPPGRSTRRLRPEWAASQARSHTRESVGSRRAGSRSR